MFLGIITRDARVLLAEAGTLCPGHTEWLRNLPEVDPAHGFAIVARNGKVTEIYRASVVNRQHRDGLLDEDVLEELKAILPVSDDLTVYGH